MKGRNSPTSFWDTIKHFNTCTMAPEGEGGKEGVGKERILKANNTWAKHIPKLKNLPSNPYLDKPQSNH